MVFEEVMQYFKTFQYLGKAMNRDSQTFYYWKRSGFIPYKAQVFLEIYTKGVLKADKAHAKVISKGPYKTRCDKGIPKGPMHVRKKGVKYIPPTEIVNTNLDSMIEAMSEAINEVAVDESGTAFLNLTEFPVVSA